MGAPPEQVAFQPTNREDRAVGSWVQVAGRETREPQGRALEGWGGEAVGLWGEGYMEVEVEDVASWLQGLGDSATTPRRNQHSSMLRLHLGTRPGVITGAPCREVGGLLQSLGQLTPVVLAWSAMATPAQGRQGMVTGDSPSCFLRNVT